MKQKTELLKLISRKMAYQIDQSGKIEDTGKNTVKVKPDQILTIEDVIQALKKTGGRLRECISTLVDAQSRSIGKRYHKGGKRSI